jgi:hypothetical protein
MVQHIIFIHGYSEQSLGAYYNFPTRVSAATGIPSTEIYLSAFDSLDDDVTIGDLADALESRIVALESNGVAIGDAAVIAHSTGALVARRWILDRVLRNRVRSGVSPAPATLAVPSHFVSMAGSNHGSTLAQFGKSLLGYAQKLLTKHILTVGRRVLSDMDYGSDFLLRLNRQWLIEMLPQPDLARAGVLEGGGLSGLFAFSMGGDSHGDSFIENVLPPAAEPGSDNTVRISGANLNYTFMVADPEQQLITALPFRRVPHHIMRGYSHFGAESGVWGKVGQPDLAVDLVTAALNCADADTYERLRSEWHADLAAWTHATQNADNANSSIVFNLHDRAGAPVEDSVVVVLDKDQMDQTADVTDEQERRTQTVANLANVSKSIVSQPIRNKVKPSAVTMYFYFDRYKATAPHYYHIEAHSQTPLVQYRPISYTGPTGATDDAHVVRPNEFTYVDVTMDRRSEQTYVIYPYKTPLATATWNPPLQPFPPGWIGGPQA